MKEKPLNPRLSKTDLLLGIIATDVNQIIPFYGLMIFGFLIATFAGIGLDMAITFDPTFNNPVVNTLYGNNIEEAKGRGWFMIGAGLTISIAMLYSIHRVMQRDMRIIRNILGIDRKYYERNFDKKV